MNQKKIGICQWSLPVDGPYGCKIAAELGLSGIQLDIGSYKKGFQLSKTIVQEGYLEEAEKYGISFPSIAITDLDNYSMVHPGDSLEKEIAITAIRKAIEAAEAMHIPLVMIPSFEANDIRSEDDFIRAVSVLRWACDYAGERGITISTENLLSTEEIIRLFQSVNRPNLKLFFDTQNHYLKKGFDIPEMLESLMPLICEIHVKDGKDGILSGALLGEGETKFFQSMEILKKYNYKGWIISENYYYLEPLSLQNDNPINLILKDIQTLKLIGF